MLQLQSYSQVLSTLRRRRGARQREEADRIDQSVDLSAAAASVAADPASAAQLSADPTVRVELIDAVPSLGTGRDRAIRVANVIIAALLLIAFSPVMLLVAIAVRLTSPGPVVYRQVRVGVDRRRYRGLSPLDRRAERDRRGDSRVVPGRRRSLTSAIPASNERRERTDRRHREMDRRMVQMAVAEDRRRQDRRDAAVGTGSDRRSRIATALSDRRTWNVY